MTGLLYRFAGALRPLAALRARLGLWRAPADVPDDVAALLTRAAEAFLRAGGSVTARVWLGLSVPERGALVAAGNRLRADVAAGVGWASQGRQEALAMYGLLDGGRLAGTVGLEVAAIDAARRAREGVP